MSNSHFISAVFFNQQNNGTNTQMFFNGNIFFFLRIQNNKNILPKDNGLDIKKKLS